MEGAAVIAALPDWQATESRAIQYLTQVLRPVQYRELCRHALVGPVVGYSSKTDHAEKFRQRYAEHRHDSIVVVKGGPHRSDGGNLGLRRWFPTDHESMVIPPDPLVIEGQCLVSYHAGYEHARREPYLKDWYGDADSQRRWDRRMLAFQFESHVRSYYLANWPQLCQPPTNHRQYERPADNDFLLNLPTGRYKVDVKSATFQEEGCAQYKARRIYRDVIYVAGEWNVVLEKAVVRGVVPGRWLREIAAYDDGDFFSDRDLMSFEVLSVMLNMAQAGMDYRQAIQSVRDAEPKYRSGKH